MTNKPMLGELLVSNNIVSKEVINQALKLQVGGNRRLGSILVRMKVITDDQLAETLASQLGIAITDLQQSFSPEVKKILPRYLCNMYGVLPLKFKPNNVLQLAMTNPSDNEAINDLENYTGRVVEPCLARHSDIDRQIPLCIPLSLKDFFSPKVNTMANRVVATIALMCVIGLGIYTFDYIQKVRQGTISVTADYTLYHHHDLTFAVAKKGGYSLQGHAAFADGLYKAEFSDLKNIEAFIQKREKDFSGVQKDWLKWVLQQAGKGQSKQLVAQK
ncbi:GspE/PulE/PilB domain-containing protein [Desulfopila aestuarii]|uniref:Type II secretion system (T2SS), protein E, N-terminal domain n=1 Tax=Desulfopila aestuarii DSM 18488 TaxID=1121416 RepID=A0A1M7YG06_9BACT|nr:hypothetical protein [Desulfopila aestuarii]SHO51448.1 Type II secretion system (T2SS), protein E, N-terminal domain [Desulfopila aestuarii DSM 18488]